MSFESLITASGKGSLSISGPGPKTLVAGDSTFGYCGPVPIAELFTSSEIAQQYPGIAGIGTMAWGIDLLWHKFVINRKVVYIATAAMNTSCTWNDLYAQGFIYGTDDNGLVPAATPVNQWRPLTKNVNGVDWVLTPRAMRLSADDLLPTTTAPDLDALALLNIVKLGVGRGKGIWGQINPANTGYNWTLNTYTSTTGALVHGINSGVSWAAKTGSIPYFPVLDLQDASKVTLPVANMRGTVPGLKEPALAANVNYADAVYPVDPISITYLAGGMKTPRVLSTSLNGMVIAPNAISYQPYFKQPVIKLTLS